MSSGNNTADTTGGDLESLLGRLQDQVRLVEQSYNPAALNLHFDLPARADSALFEALYSVGLEAWHAIESDRSWGTSPHSREIPHWFYDFFLLISSASSKIIDDQTQQGFSKELIECLVLLLVDVSRITTMRECEGDIVKRDFEALANLFLAFRKVRKLRNLAMAKAEETNNPRVIEFVKGTIQAVRQIEITRSNSS